MIKEKKGFTLAELLIVVAIIGVLVAISIPIFTMQMRKARLATNQANARAAYAAAYAAMIEDPDGDGFGNGNNAYCSFVYDLSTGKASFSRYSQQSTEWPTGTEDYITYHGKVAHPDAGVLSAWTVEKKGEKGSCLSDKVYTKWKIDIGNGKAATTTNKDSAKVGELFAVCWQK